ncbi:MAG: tRNA dihydrouridine synthase DusB [Clostridia bacterium]|nr:tRNA dihydrouridine synthase DusB [Clostridia bacterium]
MKIGNLKFENNIFTAPMAGISDIAYRSILKEMGAGLVFTEMVSAKALWYKDKKTKQLMLLDKNEHPVAIQIFGSDPEICAYGAKMAELEGADIVDINMGCPVPKVANHGDGSALMKNPKLAGEIVKAVKSAVKIPVSVKFRKGWDDNNINAVCFAKVLEENGADMLTVHGRTKMQMYQGKADWEIISRVKESVSVPVVGNGDIFTPEDGKQMLEQTGCDGIMLARGLKGNPWLVKQTLEYINSGKISSFPTTEERKEMAIRHVFNLCKYYGENIGVKMSRSHLLWYIKGFKDAAIIRNEISRVETLEDVKKGLGSI